MNQHIGTVLVAVGVLELAIVALGTVPSGADAVAVFALGGFLLLIVVASFLLAFTFRRAEPPTEASRPYYRQRELDAAAEQLNRDISAR